jgi:3-oxoacyl-[acyl-carrier-protein] synthase-3
MGVRVGGVSAVTPDEVVDNRVFGRTLFGDDLERTIKAIGVEQRRVSDDLTALDLAVAAARRLETAAGRRFGSFGGLVFVTATPDNPMPNNATLAQHLLGLPKDSACFDVGLACSGYPYGLWVAGMMARSLDKPVLLLAGETDGRLASPRDRATSLLFADAGTATIVEPCGGVPPWRFNFITDGSMRDALIVPDGGHRSPATRESLEFPEGGERRGVDLRMDGMAVFGYVVNNVPGAVRALMESSSPGDYGALVLHQANLFMNRQVARQLNFPPDKTPVSMDRYGNVGSGSIPLTIATELLGQEPSFSSTAPLPRTLCGSRLLLAAFGAGLSIGVADVFF